MAYIDNGDTAEQAAEKVQGMMNAGLLKTTIEEIEARLAGGLDRGR